MVDVYLQGSKLHPMWIVPGGVARDPDHALVRATGLTMVTVSQAAGVRSGVGGEYLECTGQAPTCDGGAGVMLEGSAWR